MNNYPFQLITPTDDRVLADKTVLQSRPFLTFDNSFKSDAPRFVPGEQLVTAMNTAIAVGEPLLITGEPGTGKTQTAYYAAYKLNLELIHFQVKSDTTARDLLYNFDTVRYFYEANVREKGDPLPPKDAFLEKRPLWQAIEADEPRVLLIDEIDKAPRDFPNDLLHEIDTMEFHIPETDQTIIGSPKNRPILFITSNSERRLPEPFLRRCVYHHIQLDEDLVRRAVENRRDEYRQLSDGVIKLAIKQFIAIRNCDLRKRPSTGELLVWLRVLALAADIQPLNLDVNLSELPYLGALLKDHQDTEELR
jgi:MoxR-like ATPase